MLIMKVKCITSLISTLDKPIPSECELHEGEIYTVVGETRLEKNGRFDNGAYFLAEKPKNTAYIPEFFEAIPDNTESLDLDNTPILTVNEVYSFMCDSGAYLPYNRPTHQMLRNLSRSKLKIY